MMTVEDSLSFLPVCLMYLLLLRFYELGLPIIRSVTSHTAQRNGSCVLLNAGVKGNISWGGRMPEAEMDIGYQISTAVRVPLISIDIFCLDQCRVKTASLLRVASARVFPESMIVLVAAKR